MKKIFIIAAAFIMSVAAIAQDKGNLEFGFGGGVNMSSISDDDNSSETSYSFNIGGSAEYFFSDRWGIKARVIYDRKGWDRERILNEFGDAVPTDINVDYVTIPVMANWHFGRTRNWYLNFGPYVGFLVNAKDTRFKYDLKDSFNKTDAGIAFGIGVKIPLNDKLKIYFEYDGQGGFSEVFKDNDGDSRITTSRGAFNVGLNFLL